MAQGMISERLGTKTAAQRVKNQLTNARRDLQRDPTNPVLQASVQKLSIQLKKVAGK